MRSLFTRTLLAIALVLLTWNPSGWDYVDWALRDRSTFDAVKAFFGLVLLAAWVFCLRAAWVSLGALGIVLVAALLATVVWMLVQFGVVAPDDRRAMVWLALVAIAIVLGVGVSWAKLRQRASGEIETNPE
ncbi:MAG TPA: DUF6524 family protein [Casimicrobiaceae bacterium]|nr:DUF6524 family protein [Casimicrobiaceae bacterium]